MTITLLFWLQKVLPVQKAAARTFCTFLRYNRKQEQRQEMMGRLIQGQNISGSSGTFTLIFEQQNINRNAANM